MFPAWDPAGQTAYSASDPGASPRRWVIVCACGYRSALPVEAIIARLGELCPVESALLHLRCGACRARGSSHAKMVRLCELGCPRQRG